MVNEHSLGVLLVLQALSLFVMFQPLRCHPRAPPFRAKHDALMPTCLIFHSIICQKRNSWAVIRSIKYTEVIPQAEMPFGESLVSHYELRAWYLCS